MSLAEGIKPTTELPAEWLATSVARYIDDPFSEEALAEPNKTCIDLGALDVAACFEASGPAYIKDHNEIPKIGDNEPLELIRAHQLIMNASRMMLGEKRFMESEIAFEFRKSMVEPGKCQARVGPHVDGRQEDRLNEHQLRLVGLACNVLPTILLNGALSPTSLYSDGSLAHTRGMYKRFRVEELPTSRLVLAPPAMLHDTARLPSDATEPVERLFMRWHVRV